MSVSYARLNDASTPARYVLPQSEGRVGKALVDVVQDVAFLSDKVRSASSLYTSGRGNAAHDTRAYTAVKLVGGLDFATGIVSLSDAHSMLKTAGKTHDKALRNLGRLKMMTAAGETGSGAVRLVDASLKLSAQTVGGTSALALKSMGHGFFVLYFGGLFAANGVRAKEAYAFKSTFQKAENKLDYLQDYLALTQAEIDEFASVTSDNTDQKPDIEVGLFTDKETPLVKGLSNKALFLAANAKKKKIAKLSNMIGRKGAITVLQALDAREAKQVVNVEAVTKEVISGVTSKLYKALLSLLCLALITFGVVVGIFSQNTNLRFIGLMLSSLGSLGYFGIEGKELLRATREDRADQTEGLLLFVTGVLTLMSSLVVIFFGGKELFFSVELPVLILSSLALLYVLYKRAHQCKAARHSEQDLQDVAADTLPLDEAAFLPQ